MMRCNLWFLVIATLLAVGVSKESPAAPIALTNPSFEDPAGAKTVGDATWSNIPGWTSTGPSGDSGLEAFSPAPQPELGVNIAFLQSGDGAIFQTTGHTIQGGDNFLLNFYERNDFEAEELTVRFYYDDGARNVFDTQTIALTDVGRGGPLTQQLLTASAPGAAVGSLLGIEFENTSAGGSGEWLWVDLVTLETGDPPMPGDVNGDMLVDLTDYGIIRDNFRSTGVTRAMGDLTGANGGIVGDGVVDFYDFVQWRENAPAAVLAAAGFPIPEPATGSLIVVGFAIAAVHCQRRRIR